VSVTLSASDGPWFVVVITQLKVLPRTMGPAGLTVSARSATGAGLAAGGGGAAGVGSAGPTGRGAVTGGDVVVVVEVVVGVVCVGVVGGTSSAPVRAVASGARGSVKARPSRATSPRRARARRADLGRVTNGGRRAGGTHAGPGCYPHGNCPCLARGGKRSTTRMSTGVGRATHAAPRGAGVSPPPVRGATGSRTASPSPARRPARCRRS
jgi:hypothetical protein